MNVNRMRRQLRRVGVLPVESERFIPGFQEAIVAMEQRYQEELKVREFVERFREVARQVDAAGPDRLTRQIQVFRDDAARAEAERREVEIMDDYRRKILYPW